MCCNMKPVLTGWSLSDERQINELLTVLLLVTLLCFPGSAGLLYIKLFTWWTKELWYLHKPELSKTVQLQSFKAAQGCQLSSVWAKTPSVALYIVLLYAFTIDYIMWNWINVMKTVDVNRLNAGEAVADPVEYVESLYMVCGWPENEKQECCLSLICGKWDQPILSSLTSTSECYWCALF